MLTGAPRPGATHPIVGMADQLGIEPILETGSKEQAFGAHGGDTLSSLAK